MTVWVSTFFFYVLLHIHKHSEPFIQHIVACECVFVFVCIYMCVSHIAIAPCYNAIHNSTTQSDEAECICCYYGCFIIVTKSKHTIEVKRRIERRFTLFFFVCCYFISEVLKRYIYIYGFIFNILTHERKNFFYHLWIIVSHFCVSVWKNFTNFFYYADVLLVVLGFFSSSAYCMWISVCICDCDVCDFMYDFD